VCGAAAVILRTAAFHAILLYTIVLWQQHCIDTEAHAMHNCHFASPPCTRWCSVPTLNNCRQPSYCATRHGCGAALTFIAVRCSGVLPALAATAPMVSLTLGTAREAPAP
jgi:hypothetical protein